MNTNQTEKAPMNNAKTLLENTKTTMENDKMRPNNTNNTPINTPTEASVNTTLNPPLFAEFNDK